MPVDMKRMIAETLAEMMKRKKVDKITVKELVEACGISRQTFYYHFQDLMEVIEWLAAQAFQKSFAAGLAASTPQETLKRMILDVMENEDTIQRLMASQRREEIERLLVRNTCLYLEKMLRAKAVGLTAQPADLEMAIHFYSYGLVGMLLENMGKEKDADIFAQKMFRLLTGEVLCKGNIAAD